MKARAQKRTSNATASPESLAKKRSGNSEEEVMAMCLNFEVVILSVSVSHSPNSVKIVGLKELISYRQLS